jgi:hypothetical protein
MKSKEAMLNASMMQLRAKAATCAATVEAILESPITSVDGTNYVDAITENMEKLAYYDTAIKILHTTFLSPMGEERRKSQANVPEGKAMQEQFRKMAEAAATKNRAKTDLYPPKAKAAIATKKTK